MTYIVSGTPPDLRKHTETEKEMDDTATVEKPWNLREDVVEEIVEIHGWLYAGSDIRTAYTRQWATWQVTEADGTSVLDVPGDEHADGYHLTFSSTVPAYLVAKACAEAAADCRQCGTACEGDHVPDGIYNGEIR